MPDYTVEAVLDMREWVGDHGTFHIYDVEFSGEQGSGKAEIKRKSTSPAPKAGDVIDAEIVTKGDRTELKRIWQENKPSASKGSGWQPKSPAERAEIRRLAAQKAAVVVLGHQITIAAATGDSERFKGKTANELLTPLIDYFDGDAKKAGEDA